MRCKAPLMIYQNRSGYQLGAEQATSYLPNQWLLILTILFGSSHTAQCGWNRLVHATWMIPFITSTKRLTCGNSTLFISEHVIEWWHEMRGHIACKSWHTQDDSYTRRQTCQWLWTKDLWYGCIKSKIPTIWGQFIRSIVFRAYMHPNSNKK